MKKIIITEMFNFDFYNKFIKFGLFRFSAFLHTVRFNCFVFWGFFLSFFSINVNSALFGIGLYQELF